MSITPKNGKAAQVFEHVRQSKLVVEKLRRGRLLQTATNTVKAEKEKGVTFGRKSFKEDLRATIHSASSSVGRRNAIDPLSTTLNEANNVASNNISDYCIEIAVQACLRSDETNERLAKTLDYLEKEGEEWIEALHIHCDESDNKSILNDHTTTQLRNQCSLGDGPKWVSAPTCDPSHRTPYISCPISYGSVIALKATHGGYLATDFGRHCSMVTPTGPSYLHQQLDEFSKNSSSQTACALFTIWNANKKIGVAPEYGPGSTLCYGDAVTLQCGVGLLNVQHSDTQGNVRILASSGVMGKDWGELVEDHLGDYDRAHEKHQAKSAMVLGTSGGSSRHECKRLIKEYEEYLIAHDKATKNSQELKALNLHRQSSEGVRLVTLPAETEINRHFSGEVRNSDGFDESPAHGSYLRGKWIVTHVSEPLKAIGREVGHGDQIVLEQGWLSLASKTAEVAHLLPQDDTHLQLHEQDRSFSTRKTNQTASPDSNDANKAALDLEHMSQFSWKLDLVQLPSTAPLERLWREEAKQSTRVFRGTEQNIRNLEKASEMVRGLKLTEFSPSLHPAYARRQENLEKYLKDRYHDRSNGIGVVNPPLTTNSALAAVYGPHSWFARQHKKQRLKERRIIEMEETVLHEFRQRVPVALRARLLADAQRKHGGIKFLSPADTKRIERQAARAWKMRGHDSLMKIVWASSIITNVARLFLKSRWKKQLRDIDLALVQDKKTGSSAQWTYPFRPSEIDEEYVNLVDNQEEEKDDDDDDDDDDDISIESNERMEHPQILSNHMNKINVEEGKGGGTECLSEITRITLPTSCSIHSFKDSLSSQHAPNEPTSTPSTVLSSASQKDDSTLLSRKDSSLSDRERLRLLRYEFPDLLMGFQMVKKTNKKSRKSYRRSKHCVDRDPSQGFSHKAKKKSSSVPHRDSQTPEVRQKIAYEKMLRSSTIKVVDHLSPAQFEERMRLKRLNKKNSGSDSDSDSDIKIKYDEDENLTSTSEVVLDADKLGNGRSIPRVQGAKDHSLGQMKNITTKFTETQFQNTLDLSIKRKPLFRKTQSVNNGDFDLAVNTEISKEDMSKSRNGKSMTVEEAFHELFADLPQLDGVSPSHDATDLVETAYQDITDLTSFDPCMTQVSASSPCPVQSKPVLKVTVKPATTANHSRLQALSSLNNGLKVRPVSAPIKNARNTQKGVEVDSVNTESRSTSKIDSLTNTEKLSSVTPEPTHVPVHIPPSRAFDGVFRSPSTKAPHALTSPIPVDEKCAYSWSNKKEEKCTIKKTAKSRIKTKVNKRRKGPS